MNEEQNDLFRLLIQFKDYAIIRIDRDGNILSWNLGAEHIYRYTSAEVLGQSIAICSNGDDGQNAKDDLILFIAKEKGRAEVERREFRKGGEPFYANTIITAFYREDGTVKGFAKVTQDITEKKTLEDENRLLHEQLEEKVRQRTKELEVVNKELEAFSYSVSHDLRTPLRAIGGYSAMLKEDFGPLLDAEANRLIDTILANTRMMGELIDDLLKFSKMARLETIYEAIDMNQLVQTCLNGLTFDDKRYAISVAALPPCNGDPTMLKQVWMNLLANAIKYSSKNEKPNIEVGATMDARTITYYIKDNGVGFDMKYASKLFGVFQRLHRQDEFEGTGLGLALAKRIISKHNGEIWTEAIPDKGATFYFSIPKNSE